MTDKRRAKLEYKSTARPIGVFLIRNTTNNRIFLVASVDLPGGINRHRFQLKAGGHPNRELQKDWTELGAEKFEFEIVEELQPPEDPGFDVRRELDAMETLWLEELTPYEPKGYNEKKISRTERLSRIAAKQTSE